MADVRPATTDDLPKLGTAAAAAFEDDPIWRWLTSPRVDWMPRASKWFSKEFGLRVTGASEVFVDDQARGVAVWSPPGKWRNSALDAVPLAIPSARLFGMRTVRSIRTVLLMEKLHPREPHWYLHLLATDPAHQGHGIGSSLIERTLRRCDEEGVPAYLESSKEANVPFYRRHGFEVTGTVRAAGGGPEMYLMWRDPLPPDRW